jgi:dolichol-phosphate mannosyltransferase
VSVAVLFPTAAKKEEFESPTRESVAVLLPTYCEAENIENLIREIHGLKLNITIVVIDDSSPDGTADIVSKLNEKYGDTILISRSVKLGLGTAITDGFRYTLGLRKPHDFIVTMDSDYSHDPRDIQRLIEVAKKGYDLVVGSRYIQGGKVVGWSWKRWLISRVANVIATITVRTKLHDCTSGFRCYSKQYVRSVLNDLHSETYEIQIETVRQARLKNFKIKEIPITFVNRKRGKSKLTRIESTTFMTYILKTMLTKLLLKDQNETKSEPY